MNETLMNLVTAVIGVFAAAACIWAFIMERKGDKKEDEQQK